MKNKNILIAIGILVVVGIVAFVIINNPTNSNPDVVATVNGEDIEYEDYQFIFDQFEQTYSQQGQEVSDSQLQQQVIDQVVAQTLLAQKAEEEGYEVTEEEIDEQYQNVVNQAGGEEAINQVLEDLNLTEDFIREDIKQQLIIQKYVDAQKEGEDFSVTQEEIDAFYQQFAAGQEAAPALSELEGQIRTQLETQKENEFIRSIVDQLKQLANIEINL